MINNEDIDLKHFNDSSREGRRLFAEGLGTFLSVLASLATKVLFVKTGQVSWEMMAFARGLVVTIVIYFMGSISGAHLNPVVTLGFAIRRNFPWRRVPGYLIAQFIGAFIAGLLVLFLFGTDGQLGASVPGKGFSDFQALILEIILTAGLINTILGTAYEGRNIGANGGIAVGGYIVLASILGLSVSGASMNPFRSLVPDILRGDYSSTWIYIIAPLAGMTIGVVFETILRGAPGSEGNKTAQGKEKEGTMKAIVFNGIGDIRLENVREPKIKDPLDAIVRITASAICGTDLHMIRGTMTGMKPGTILGHEGVGIVEEVGPQVRNFKKGDRVVIASTISCGYCSYCRTGYFAQCDNANPTHKGTAFFGGPAESGPIDGMQAEWVRVPYAHVGMVRIPEGVTDDQAILLSDIFPTGYFGAHLAEIKPGNTVAVFGCGPVGQFAILSAFLRGAGRVFAVDRIDSRLKSAQNLNAEIINFDKEDPINAIKELTGGTGVDRIIDAVGIDSVKPSHGPALKTSSKHDEEFKTEVKKIAPETHPAQGNWIPGNAPSQTLRWAVEALAKAGTLSIIGVYPATAEFFPIGIAMNKNLTINMGNCNHRRYIPELLDLVQRGTVKPEEILTKQEPLLSAIDAYKSFDKREEGWLKVELLPGQNALNEELVPYVSKD